MFLVFGIISCKNRFNIRCNTKPQAPKSSDINYTSENKTDKFIIKNIPNEGLHKDIKKIKVKLERKSKNNETDSDFKEKIYDKPSTNSIEVDLNEVFGKTNKKRGDHFITVSYIDGAGLVSDEIKGEGTKELHRVSISVMGGFGGKIEAELDGSKFETSYRVKTFYVELPKEEVTIKAIPNAGYKVKEWLNAPVTQPFAEKVTFDVTEDINIFVRFEKKPSVVGMNAILTLGGKKEISVRVKTADGSPVEVKGCDETSLDSSEKDKTTLHAKDETVILAGDIIELDCEKCGLTELDVQGLTNLQKLVCYTNQLKSLDVQGLTNLQELDCFSNSISSLNVQSLTSLQKLDCGSNPLGSLNVKDMASLKNLACSNNNLDKLNLQGLTNLQELNCGNNKLKELNVQNLTNLKSLDCSSNPLGSLPELQGLDLHTLNCKSINLNKLDVQSLNNLQKLVCSDNPLESFNIQGLNDLTSLTCINNNLHELDVQGLNKLTWLDCENNQLTSLNLEGLTKLNHLYCKNNKLEDIKFIKDDFINLKKISCYNNKLQKDFFKKLLDALPDRTGNDAGEYFFFEDGDSNYKCSYDELKVIHDKNWMEKK